MKARAFVVHLARAAERKAQAKKLLRELPFSGEVIDAVDGLALSDAEIAAVYSPGLHKPPYPFGLRKQEIGAFLSHRKAWQAIAEGENDFGLIVEDDVEIDVAKLGKILALAERNVSPADYLRFPQKLDEQGSRLASGSDVSILEPDLPGLGMVLQLVGRKAAAALLEATKRFDRPVDTTIQMRWLHPARILSCRPVCVREISAAMGGTLIQKKRKPLGEVLEREIRRPLYRLAVRRRNAKGRAGA
jgi:GR25 family glycosyltransferase involved in LPS biosynthesis